MCARVGYVEKLGNLPTIIAVKGHFLSGTSSLSHDQPHAQNAGECPAWAPEISEAGRGKAFPLGTAQRMKYGTNKHKLNGEQDRALVSYCRLRLQCRTLFSGIGCM